MHRTSKILTSILTCVGASRFSLHLHDESQNAGAEQVLANIGALLHHRHNGVTRISEILKASKTPGAESNYVQSLEDWIKAAESETEPLIKQAQAATQKNIDDAVNKLRKASSDADEAKAAADHEDEAWFGCVAEEKEKKQGAENAQQKEASSQEKQTEACQLQQDNKDFSYDANRTLGFECDFGEGDCDSAYATFVDSLETVRQDAKAKLQEHEARYTELKAACDLATSEMEAAQKARVEADEAWSDQRSRCQTAEKTRVQHLCQYGKAVQAKCVDEGEYNELIAATKASNTTDSEPDRADEWSTIGQFKCLVEKSIEYGLDRSVDTSDVEACASAGNFEQQVEGLNRREKEVDELVGSHQCTEGPISFYNGQAWDVTADPAASDYVQTEFNPVLNPREGQAPFDFCQDSLNMQQDSVRLPRFEGIKCEVIKFEESFSTPPFVHATIDHRTYNGGAVHDANTLWVQEIDESSMRACVAETAHHDGVHDDNAHISYTAFEIAPANAVTGTEHWDGWSNSDLQKCGTIKFSTPFDSDNVKIVATIFHDKGKGGNALTEWVQGTTKDSFRMCVREPEYHDGGHHPLNIGYLAWEKDMPGLVSGRTRWTEWTEGTKCERINFEQEFEGVPIVQATVNHDDAAHDATHDSTTMWLEEVTSGHFRVCVRELKHHAEGAHDSINIDWFARVSGGQ